MNREQKIQVIVDALVDAEGSLSDGYGWYCGSDQVGATLRRIAESILAAIGE